MKFELFLFGTNPALVRDAVAAGIDGIVVDWEHRGKLDRQQHVDTEINRDTPEDLRRARVVTDAPIICRINRVSDTTGAELDLAIENGATEILVPMVRRVDEVETVLRLVRGRRLVGILVETVAATQAVDALARLPLSRVFVGLNDLAIERGARNIFTAIADGTVERIRRAFEVPVGFGGLTLPDRGHPIPCRLLLGEMARLDCRFSFLRRSFHRDMRGRVLSQEVPRLCAALVAAGRRSPIEVQRDHGALNEAILAMNDQWTSVR